MNILLDPEDKWLLKAYSWYPTLRGKGRNVSYSECYIRGLGRGNHHMLLHQAIMGRPIDGTVIDHINRDGLDNRRANLRFVSRSINARNYTNLRRKNKTGYRGVKKVKGKFHGYITINKKKTYLGTFKTAEKAYLAYLMAGGEV